MKQKNLFPEKPVVWFSKHFYEEQRQTLPNGAGGAH